MAPRAVWNVYEPDNTEPITVLNGRFDLSELIDELKPFLQERYTEPVIITVVNSRTLVAYQFPFTPEVPVE